MNCSIRLVALVFSGLMIGVAAGQAQQLSISGTVNNAQGVVPEVNVNLRGPGGSSTDAHTDAEGKYHFTGLNAGSYRLAFVMAGFGTVIRTESLSGQSQTLDVTLPESGFTHLHLLLNHFPTIGTIIGLGLFLFALLGKSDELKRASLIVFVGISLLTIPTYMTGNAAKETICIVPASTPDGPCLDHAVSRGLIETHEGVALLAFSSMELTGAVAWLGLWQYRRRSRPPSVTLAAVLVLSLVTVGLVAWAANIGGEIRHAEIRLVPETTTPMGHLARQVGGFVLHVPWGWPVCETLHFIGLSLLIGVVLIVDLRMLGVMKNVSFPALHRLLPWGILGFGINVITGSLFFIAAPEQYTGNGTFHWKIILVLLAGVNALYFTVFDEAWTLKPGDDAPFTAKVVAVSAMALWVAIMYCGSMLPFLGNAF